MRLSGLLQIRKQGGQVLYSLKQPRVLDVLDCVRHWDIPGKQHFN
jgi:hypothetical protein